MAIHQADLHRSSIGILLVEDHAVVRSSLRLLLAMQPGMTVVGEAGNRAEALTLAAEELPDVILLDLCLGEESGMELIPELLEAAKGTRVIVLTAVQDGAEYRRAIRQGAMGVLHKGVPADLLIKAIDRVHAGELWLNRCMTALLVDEFRSPAESAKISLEGGKIRQLTDRELEIVALIGEGLKNKQIADRLCISEPTVRHHLTSILRKLELSDRLELLIYAYKNGLVAIKT